VALFYAYQDPRVSGLVLLKQWVRTPAGEAKAYLRHYYAQRLLSADFWRGVLAGRFVLGQSGRGVLDIVRRAVSGARHAAAPADASPAADAGRPLPDRMAEALARFQGKVLLVLSGRDLTAQEFRDAVAASARWRELLAEARVSRRVLAVANHTLSHRAWRDCVARWTLDWMGSW
jgi:hypothetical protein